MKRKISIWLAWFVLCGSALTSALGGRVQAQPVPTSGNGLKIAPVRREITIEKGKSFTDTISLENVTTTKTTIRSVVNDFVPSQDESGIAKIILDENKSAPGNSFKTLVPQKLPELNLKAKEHQDVKVTISVPTNAAAGGYYGVVRFAPAGSDLSENLSLTASVGTLYLIRVPGAITEKMSLTQFSVEKDGKPGNLFQTGPVQVISRFKNDGNIHLQPFGRITLKNWRRQTLQTIEINQTEPRGNVLPGSVRRFQTGLTKARGIGRYTLEGNFGYGENGQLLMAKLTFYIIPYWLIICLIVLLLGLVFGLPLLVKRYNRRIIARATRSRR